MHRVQFLPYLHFFQNESELSSELPFELESMYPESSDKFALGPASDSVTEEDRESCFWVEGRGPNACFLVMRGCCFSSDGNFLSSCSLCINEESLAPALFAVTESPITSSTFIAVALVLVLESDTDRDLTFLAGGPSLLSLFLDLPKLTLSLLLFPFPFLLVGSPEEHDALPPLSLVSECDFCTSYVCAI